MTNPPYRSGGLYRYKHLIDFNYWTKDEAGFFRERHEWRSDMEPASFLYIENEHPNYALVIYMDEIVVIGIEEHNDLLALVEITLDDD